MNLRESEQRRWEERRRQSATESASSQAEHAVSAPSPSERPTSAPAARSRPPEFKTPLDAMREGAYFAFDARLAELRRRRNELEGKREHMTAACTGTTRGSSLGSIVDLTNPAASQELSSLTTTSNIEIDNETTPQCRVAVADVERETASIDVALNRVEEEGRRMGIYPGVLRELFAVHQIRR